MWDLPLQLPRRLLIGAVQAYRLLLKPWVGNVCRFEPSCSSYTLQALKQYGALGGSALGAWRVLRCQPWCDGGCDPVPSRLRNPAAGLFTRFGPPPAGKAIPSPTSTPSKPLS